MKRGQFSFVWIFAILAGGAILALAIYGAVQAGGTLRHVSDSEAAKNFAILTDPLHAGFAEGSFGKISFRQETRLNNFCFNDGKFGANELSVATRSGVGEEWILPGEPTSVYNKYIFSKGENVGFDYGVFSKPFEFPYEVSDLIFLMDGEYCFLNAPEVVENEVLDLGIDNILFGNCSSEIERVCFGSGEDCDSIVYGSCSGGCDSIYDEGVVSKASGELRYVGNLMWGAIFSDNGVYECNVERLMYRTKSIADVFASKTDLMDARDCGTNLKGDLIVWGGLAGNATSGDLTSLANIAETMDRKNNLEDCKIW
jgi:hypothetical protein